MLDSTRDRARHQLLLGGDLTVRDSIASDSLPVIRRALRRRWPRADHAFADISAHDAIMGHFDRPRHYDPARGSLDHYLIMVAGRRMIDLLRKVQRRARHEEPFGDKAPDVSVVILVHRPIWPQLLIVFRLCRTLEERAFMRAYVQGERRAGILGAILGVEDALPDAQRNEARKTLERIRLRVKRWISGHPPHRGG